MKKATLFLVPLICGPACLGALLPPEVSISSDLTFSSNYVFRGIKQAGNSFQPNVELSRPLHLADAVGGDLYGGVWGNLPTGAEETEFHYYGGYAFLPPGIDSISFDLGLTVYHFPNSEARRTHEVYVGGQVGLPEFPEVRGTIFYLYDLDVRSHVAEAAITYTYSLEGIGLPGGIDFSVLGGVQGGSRVKTESYRYYGGAVELPLMLSDYSMVTAGLHYETAERVAFAPGERGRNLFWRLGFATFF